MERTSIRPPISSLNNLIARREKLRFKEEVLTEKIKLKRKIIVQVRAEKKQSAKNTPNDRLREKLAFLRASAAMALKARGATKEEIVEIIGLSYGQILHVGGVLENHNRWKIHKWLCGINHLCDALDSTNKFKFCPFCGDELKKKKTEDAGA